MWLFPVEASRFELSLRQSSGPRTRSRGSALQRSGYRTSVFTHTVHSRIQTSKRQSVRASPADTYTITTVTTSFLAWSLLHESTSTANHLTARPSHRQVMFISFSRSHTVHPLEHDSRTPNLDTDGHKNVANHGFCKSRHVLPNLVEVTCASGRGVWGCAGNV